MENFTRQQENFDEPQRSEPEPFFNNSPEPNFAPEPSFKSEPGEVFHSEPSFAPEPNFDGGGDFSQPPEEHSVAPIKSNAKFVSFVARLFSSAARKTVIVFSL